MVLGLLICQSPLVILHPPGVCHLRYIAGLERARLEIPADRLDIGLLEPALLVIAPHPQLIPVPALVAGFEILPGGPVYREQSQGLLNVALVAGLQVCSLVCAHLVLAI
jgi:hypothetical protein